jgi:hypothetical protein
VAERRIALHAPRVETEETSKPNKDGLKKARASPVRAVRNGTPPAALVAPSRTLRSNASRLFGAGYADAIGKSHPKMA